MLYALIIFFVLCFIALYLAHRRKLRRLLRFPGSQALKNCDIPVATRTLASGSQALKNCDIPVATRTLASGSQALKGDSDRYRIK
jgi:hypothetical protein